MPILWTERTKCISLCGFPYQQKNVSLLKEISDPTQDTVKCCWNHHGRDIYDKIKPKQNIQLSKLLENQQKRELSNLGTSLLQSVLWQATTTSHMPRASCMLWTSSLKWVVMITLKKGVGVGGYTKLYLLHRSYKSIDIINLSITAYSIVEIIIQTQKMVFVSGIMLVDILEKLYLIEALIKKIFVVLNNFHTNIHACVKVMCLYSFAKRSWSQILSNMITPSYDRIQNNVEILVLLKASSVRQKPVSSVKDRLLELSEETNNRIFQYAGNYFPHTLNIITY